MLGAQGESQFEAHYNFNLMPDSLGRFEFKTIEAYAIAPAWILPRRAGG